MGVLCKSQGIPALTGTVEAFKHWAQQAQVRLQRKRALNLKRKFQCRALLGKTWSTWRAASMLGSAMDMSAAAALTMGRSPTPRPRVVKLGFAVRAQDML